jgi:serine/threonine-protein kinase
LRAGDAPELQSWMKWAERAGVVKMKEESAWRGVSVVSIPGYQVVSEVARHSNGILYAARETATGRDVCLEVFQRWWPGTAEDVYIEERRRHVLETVSLLDHPNIWPVLRLGLHERTSYFVRPLVEGVFLEEHLRGEPPSPAHGVEWGRQLALAAQYAHEHGVVHCDIKPGNVFLRRDVREGLVPLLTGFDTAVVYFLPAALVEQADGMIVGTPAYMSPEQMIGRRPDFGPAVDIWGLGALLYRVLGGRRPFESPTVVDLFRAALETPPPPLREVAPELDLDLERIVMRCLRKTPDERFATASDLATALARYQRGERDAPESLARRLGNLVRGWWGAREEGLVNRRGT